MTHLWARGHVLCRGESPIPARPTTAQELPVSLKLRLHILGYSRRSGRVKQEGVPVQARSGDYRWSLVTWEPREKRKRKSCGVPVQARSGDYRWSLVTWKPREKRKRKSCDVVPWIPSQKPQVYRCRPGVVTTAGVLSRGNRERKGKENPVRCGAMDPSSEASGGLGSTAAPLVFLMAVLRCYRCGPSRRLGRDTGSRGGPQQLRLRASFYYLLVCWRPGVPLVPFPQGSLL
ncbi:hypothetical protein NDU88_005095 [Pleurodeles waltl]|uniref:Uncharacterized protein n=1 Tax=Pleurodeles waltl TaxID=8319 RepID=A0AAV7L083_PLEWA|nr:hypothetical protein NDU88_005095 [Pleurodeles waltl]